MRNMKSLFFGYIMPLCVIVGGLSATALHYYGEYKQSQEHVSNMQTKNQLLVEQLGQMQEQHANITTALQQKETELSEKNKQIAHTSQQLGDMKQVLADIGLPTDRDIRFSDTLQVKATAYSADPAENGGTYNGKVLTKTGFSLTDNPNAKVIAVDPRVIPLGSTVWVQGYGLAKALDTGGAIKGNRIDVFINDKQKMNSWGVRHLQVKVLAEA